MASVFIRIYNIFWIWEYVCFFSFHRTRATEHSPTKQPTNQITNLYQTVTIYLTQSACLLQQMSFFYFKLRRCRWEWNAKRKTWKNKNKNNTKIFNTKWINVLIILIGWKFYFRFHTVFLLGIGNRFIFGGEGRRRVERQALLMGIGFLLV